MTCQAQKLIVSQLVVVEVEEKLDGVLDLGSPVGLGPTSRISSLTLVS